MTLHADPVARWERRVADLAALFSTIARTRMAGVPVLNAALLRTRIKVENAVLASLT